MTTVLETFDSGTPGNAVVAGTNGIDTILEGTQTYETGLHGTTSVRAGAAANTASTRFRVSLGMSGDHSGSVYLKNNTAHGSGSSSVNFFHIASSTNAFLAQFRAAPSNALGIRVNNVDVRTGSLNEIPVGVWFRLDWQLSGTTLNWRIFYSPEGTTPDLSGTVTTVNGPAAVVILGAQSSATIPKDWSFDTVRTDSTGAWFSPFSPPSNPSTGFTVWDGTQEVDVVSVTMWNGTTEVPIEFDSIV